MAENVTESVAPLFIKINDLPDKVTSAYQICQAASRVITAASIEGAQRQKNVWKLYIKNKKSRVALAIKQNIIISGKIVKIFDSDPNSFVANKTSDKITIRGVPIGVPNVFIKDTVERMGINFVSSVKDSYERDEHGELTSFKNGDRFAYILPPEAVIERNVSLGEYSAVIIHHGRNNISCRACGAVGHKLGSETCPALPKDNTILAFKGYQNPLSNHFPCNLLMFNQKEPFRSLEHALFWKMAMDLKKPDLANSIKNAKHAGVAKSLSKNISETDRHHWEQNNEALIENMIIEKLRQCEPFKNIVMENQGKIFAEATMDKRWGTGLAPHISEKTMPNFWPGKNMLGNIITNMANELHSLFEELEANPIPGSLAVSSVTEPNIAIVKDQRNDSDSDSDSTRISNEYSEKEKLLSADSSLESEAIHGKCKESDNLYDAATSTNKLDSEDSDNLDDAVASTNQLGSHSEESCNTTSNGNKVSATSSDNTDVQSMNTMSPFTQRGRQHIKSRARELGKYERRGHSLPRDGDIRDFMEYLDSVEIKSFKRKGTESSPLKDAHASKQARMD